MVNGVFLHINVLTVTSSDACPSNERASCGILSAMMSSAPWCCCILLCDLAGVGVSPTTDFRFRDINRAKQGGMGVSFRCFSFFWERISAASVRVLGTSCGLRRSCVALECGGWSRIWYVFPVARRTSTETFCVRSLCQCSMCDWSFLCKPLEFTAWLCGPYGFWQFGSGHR